MNFANKRRVVVSGIGVVAPNGLGREAYWQALINGLSGVRPIRRFGSNREFIGHAAEVSDLDPRQYFEAHELKKVDRSNVLAMAAGVMAIQDSGLELEKENLERVGSSIGNAICGVGYAQKESEVIDERGPRWGSPYLAIAFFPCGSNGLLSIRLNMKGPVFTFCNGNTSGTDAIGMAYRMIQRGKADVMLAGGTEAPLIPLVMDSMSRDGWLASSATDPSFSVRPFDRNVHGMVLGEGASLLVLEELDHALARGAHIYAELGGFSSVNSAFDLFHPEPNGYGIERTMKDLLQESQIHPSEINWINAQGLALRDFDQMEERCAAHVFASCETPPPMSAISSWVGNSLGALGGFQAAASALAIDQRVIPPNAPLHEVASSKTFINQTAIHQEVQAVIQNSFCFMGKNSSLLFQAYES